jgi:hypothetical protein
MANSLLTHSMIAKAAMAVMKNKAVLLSKVNRELDGSFDSSTGDTISVRKPIRYSVVSGEDITGALNDTIQGKVTVTLDKYKSVPFQFSKKELSLSIEDFTARILAPAVNRLVQEVESDIANLYKKVYNFTGTPGTNPSTFLQVATAGSILDEMGESSGERYAFYNSAATTALSAALNTIFVSNIATSAIEKARFGHYGSFDCFMSQSIKAHTVGAWGGTPLINGASQSVTYLASKDVYTQSLVTDGWTNSITGILKEGDTFTIAGVNSVNPMTLEDTGRLQSFVVRADANSGAVTGPATLTVSPAIIISGPYQTVTAAPADNAAITVTSGTAGATYRQNLAFGKDAITVAFAKLKEPEVSKVGQAESDGISIQVCSNDNILTNQNIWRLDILYACELLVPAAAVRHVGA